MLLDLLEKSFPKFQSLPALQLQRGDRPHPLTTLLENPKAQATLNTLAALKWVSANDTSWLTKPDRVNRLYSTEDFSEAAGALAEIRAYGALGAAGFSISPIPELTNIKTADFRVTTRNGDQLEVEVHSKQLHPDAAETMARAGQERDNAAVAMRTRSESGIAIVETDVQPFGAYKKPGDTTATNAISKLAAVKADEAQFSSGSAGLYLFDFQDLHNWSMGLEPTHGCPCGRFVRSCGRGYCGTRFTGRRACRFSRGLIPGVIQAERLTWHILDVSSSLQSCQAF